MVSRLKSLDIITITLASKRILLAGKLIDCSVLLFSLIACVGDPRSRRTAIHHMKPDACLVHATGVSAGADSSTSNGKIRDAG